MTKRSSSKAFTLVEVIVVIFICLFFVLFIAPLFRRPRSTAFRMVCVTNLSGIGKAMLIYAQDYDNEYPHAGGPQSVWARNVKDWKAIDRFGAYGITMDGSGGQASVSASLYLLVKYAEVEPKRFICSQDKKVSEFKPSKYNVKNENLCLLWDFGPNPQKHLSYSYQMVYSPYELKLSSDPNLAIVADRNPWIKSPFAEPKNFTLFDPNNSRESVKAGNNRSHKGDGQNVLFLDNHVSFEDKSHCGIDDDNIYTSWDGNDKARGTPPKLGSQPANELDSLLVNDPP